MKKLFSLSILFMLVLGLTGCETPSEDLTLENERLQTEIDTLKQEKADLQQALDDQQNLLDEWFDSMTSSHMNFIRVILTDVNGKSTMSYATYPDGLEFTLMDTIRNAYDVDYTETDYGTMINTINDMEVPYGAYIAISENEEMSMVGVDDIIVEDGDIFEFSVQWWDTTQEAVYDALMLFMDNQLDTYLTTDFIDYNVLLGCQDLCDGYPIYDAIQNDSVLETYLDGLTQTTVQDYFKAIMIANTMSDSVYSNTLITALNSMVVTGPYGQTGLGLLALDSYDHSEDYSSYVLSALSTLQTTTPYAEGIDAGGMSVVALANYRDEPGIQALIDEYINWIVDIQLPSGGVTTRDITWGDTVYPGTENAASISQVILALVANGLDPASGDFVQGDTNMVLRLLDFQLEDGSFDWDLTDEVLNDPAFSTPQAFLALASYYQFMNSYGADTNPYMK